MKNYLESNAGPALPGLVVLPAVGCVLWVGAANAGPALPGLVVLTAADRALPDLDFDLDSSTGSPHGLTNPNARGLRRSPVTVRRHARGGKWQAGARALGGCGSRPRGQACDGAGRLGTGRHAVRGSRQGTAVRRRQAPSSIAPSRGATRYSCHIARCSARILLN